MTIQELNEVEMHDLGIENVSIDFTAKKIHLILAFYDEIKGDYDKREIIFNEVDSLNMKDFDLDNLDDTEIYSKDITTEAGGKSNILFCLLSDFGKQSAKFSFSFSECHWAV